MSVSPDRSVIRIFQQSFCHLNFDDGGREPNASAAEEAVMYDPAERSMHTVVKQLAAEWEAWAKRTNVDTWPGPALLPWGDNAPARGRGARRGQ